MPYFRASRYRRALGFTPDEEKEVVLAARSEVAEEKKLDEMLEILRGQERLKMITAAGVVVGILYSLGQLGNLVAEVRGRRRREST